MAGGETCDTKSWSSSAGPPQRPHGPPFVQVAGRHHDPQAATRSEVTGEGPRVDPGDGRDPVIAQEGEELASVLEDGGRGIRDDERP